MEAIEAYQEALKIFDDELNPYVHRIIKNNYGSSGLETLAVIGKRPTTQDAELVDLRITRNFKETILADWRGEGYENGLKLIIRNTYVQLTPEEQSRLARKLRLFSKDFNNYWYSTREVITALESYMKFHQVDISKAIRQFDKIIKYLKTAYQWKSDEWKEYLEKLKPVVAKKYMDPSADRQLRLCKTIADVAEQLNNFKYSPDDMALYVGTYAAWADTNIKSVIGDVDGVLSYFKDETTSRGMCITLCGGCSCRIGYRIGAVCQKCARDRAKHRYCYGRLSFLPA